jgi:hypothetical protein
MFGLQQALAPNDNFCSDHPSGLKKNQIYLDLVTRPRKWLISLRLSPNDN